jgi:hypothetical protein
MVACNVRVFCVLCFVYCWSVVLVCNLWHMYTYNLHIHACTITCTHTHTLTHMHTYTHTHTHSHTLTRAVDAIRGLEGVSAVVMPHFWSFTDSHVVRVVCVCVVFYV